MKKLLMIVAVLTCLSACKSAQSNDPSDEAAASESTEQGAGGTAATDSQKKTAQNPEPIEALPPTPEDPTLEIATFAGGCFWCVEPPFDKTRGVRRTVVGYTGGKEAHPTYQQVASGQTSHAEAIRVYYDPKVVSYEELLDVFWRNINPTQENGQFVDIGAQYRTAIFVHDDEQQKLAESSKERLEKSGRFDAPIVTEIEPAETFWRAEEYHQDFYLKSPSRYKSYRSGSGRDEFIERIWSKD